MFDVATGHVIPQDHLLAISLAKGPSGHTLDFTYQSRESGVQVSKYSSLAMLRELDTINFDSKKIGQEFGELPEIRQKFLMATLYAVASKVKANI